MSWLNQIYESVLTEITADEAYPRFYQQKMSREDFDRILDGHEVDKFYRFFLDCVRDGKSSVEEAVHAIRKFESCDNSVVKQRIIEKVRNNQYEAVIDLDSDLNYFLNGGTITSRKQFAKDGYYTLGKTDRWLVTCTTNYTANNHYYGKSHWCTASDRFGKYDGYHYFRSYSGLDRYPADSEDRKIYVQFRWMGKVIEGMTKEQQRDWHPSDIDIFDHEKGYLGEELSPRYCMFQVTVDMNGNFGQNCDFLDITSNDTMPKFVGQEGLEIARNVEKVRALGKIMAEQDEPEQLYQKTLEPAIKAKKERQRQNYRRIYSEVENQCDEINRQKTEYVKRKWDEFVSNKMYESPEIMSEIEKRYFNEGEDDAEEVTDETLERTYFVHADTIKRYANNDDGTSVYIMYFHPVMGKRAYPKDDTEDYGHPIINLDYYVNTDDLGIRQYGVSVYKRNGANFELIETEINSTIEGPYDISMSDVDYEQNDCGFSYIRSYNERLNSEKVLIIDNKDGFTFEITRSCLEYGIGIGNENYIFYRYSEEGDWVLYNRNTHLTHKYTDEEASLRVFNYQECVAIGHDGKEYIYSRAFGWNGIQLPITGKLLYVSKFECEGKLFYELQYLKKADDSNSRALNAMFDGEKELVFGVDGARGHLVIDEDYGDGEYYPPCQNCHGEYIEIKLKKGKYANRRGDFADTRDSAYLRYYPQDDKYMVSFGSKWEECDKYGRTEKEIRADRYLKDFQDKGGYSPEQQAQMEKMWADREGNGEDALKAWNDADIGRDRDPYAGWGGNEREMPDEYSDDDFFRSIQQFTNPSDKWRGYMLRKDPEAYAKGFRDWWGGADDFKEKVGANPWYRIGPDGKPIDQPWNDEDEVPANPSDRVVRESKIPSKLISIWNRLGINKN